MNAANRLWGDLGANSPHTLSKTSFGFWMRMNVPVKVRPLFLSLSVGLSLSLSLSISISLINPCFSGGYLDYAWEWRRGDCSIYLFLCTHTLISHRIIYRSIRLCAHHFLLSFPHKHSLKIALNRCVERWKSRTPAAAGSREGFRIHIFQPSVFHFTESVDI
jgi:hypothetical protein